MKKQLYVLFLLILFTISAYSQRGGNTVKVNVNTNPSGAYFKIGASQYGPTPITIPLVTNQIYEITFFKDGYESKTITYKAGTGNINETLKAIIQNYTLNISSNVGGSDIYINNTLYGKAPLNVSLVEGNYNIVVKANGYKDWSTSVILKSNQNINATLVPNNYSLSIGSNVQGADAYINGQLYGKTPLTVSLAPGNYNIMLKMNGYKDYTYSFNLAKDESVYANMELMAYMISISANVNGAEVYVNGQKYGKTPYSVQLAQGTYNLVVKAPGYRDWTSTINLTQNQNILANLVPDKYTLSIGANMTGADAYINGQLYGKTPLNVSLSPGSYNIILKLDGYKDFVYSINLSKDESVYANLEAMRYIIISLPVGTKLWLNGNPYNLNWGNNIKDDNSFDNDRDDRRDKKERYREFKIYAETNNKFEVIEIRYRNTLTGPMNVEFNNKVKELKLMLVDKQ